MAEDKTKQPSGTSPQAVRSQLKVPAQFQQALDRTILAGRKVLYSAQMAPQIQQLMQSPGSMGEKLGKGVVALIGILIDKSNRTIPPQVLIPAATVLVAEAGELVQASEQDVAEGMAAAIEGILKMAKITPDQIGECQDPAQAWPGEAIYNPTTGVYTCERS